MNTPLEENIKKEFYDPAVREFDEILQRLLEGLKNIVRLIDGFAGCESRMRRSQSGQQLKLPFEEGQKREEARREKRGMLKQMEDVLAHPPHGGKKEEGLRATRGS